MAQGACGFWSWFEGRARDIAAVGSQIPEAILDEVESHLHAYCDALFFEIGGHPNSPIRELIITAEGISKHFPKVRELVAAAPAISGWQIIAFKPAQGFGFALELEGSKSAPEDAWCKTTAGDASTSLSLLVGMSQYSTERQSRLLWAIQMLLFTGLGEQSATEQIASIEVCALPSDPAAEGFFPLPELAKILGIQVGGSGT